MTNPKYDAWKRVKERLFPERSGPILPPSPSPKDFGIDPTKWRAPVPEIDNHVWDALIQELSAEQRARKQQAKTTVVENSLDKFSDAELVMHMIARGYAVMKLPKDGSPPEVLKDG